MLKFTLCAFVLWNPLTWAGNDLAELFNAYENIQIALAADNFDDAKRATDTMHKLSHTIKRSQLTKDVKSAWFGQQEPLDLSLKAALKTTDIEGLRKGFESISKGMIILAKVAKPEGLKVFHCPMAMDNKGANWLQRNETTANPYFGSSMLRCGYEVKAKK